MPSPGISAISYPFLAINRPSQNSWTDDLLSDSLLHATEECICSAHEATSTGEALKDWQQHIHPASPVRLQGGLGAAWIAQCDGFEDRAVVAVGGRRQRPQ